MSTGLLRQLAARALGAEQSLRPMTQGGAFAGGFGVPRDPAAIVDDPESGSHTSAPEPQAALSPGQPNPVGSHDRPGAADASAPSQVLQQPLEVAHRHSMASPQAQMPSPQRGADDGEAVHAATHRVAARVPQQSPDHHPTQVTATPVLRAGTPPPEAAAMLPAPAPLLPPVFTPPWAPSAADVRLAAVQRGAARAEATPTEVHVSIGRVELTASPATAPARTAPRRARSEPVSLADYLRGTPSRGRPT